MSDNIDDESFFTKFINLTLYKINNALSNPNADKYAAERAKKKEQKEKQLAAAKINTTVDTNKSNPNQFNAKRFFNKIINETTRIIKIIFFPFVALMLAMIVANEMIIYTVPIRIIFFIFTFLVCCFMTPLCIILGFYYILKGAYSYYINNMTDRTDKVIIMPTIYALLPITMYKPQSSFLRFFYYPFTYPKSAISEGELPKTMEAYWKDLNDSFKDLDKVKNLPIFSKQLEKLETKLLKILHDLSQFNSTTTTTTKLNIATVSAPAEVAAPVASVAAAIPAVIPVEAPK
ncbi:MAG: hypothetical protein WCG15_02310 [Actinomycetes bacterium]